MNLSLTELTVLLLLLVMIVPGLCHKLGRPSVIYVVYLLFGMLLTPLLTTDMRSIISAVGEIGFILLLFEIGLEIEIPRLNAIALPLRRATWWIAVQVPFLMLAAHLCGLGLVESVLVSVGFCGCSVGMAFQSWFHYHGAPRANKVDLLHWMIVLEVMAMIVLSAGYSLLRHGIGYRLLLNIGGIILTIFLISVFGDKLAAKVAYISRNTLRWRAHFWILFVLIAVSIAKHMGLPPAKAAFFLGLAISRTTHEGLALEHHLRPVSQHLLIPVFFLALGSCIPIDAWVSWTGCLAVGTAAGILLLRRLLALAIPVSTWGRHPHLLATPNLTIAAIVADLLIKGHSSQDAVAWVLMTSALITVYAIFFLNRRLTKLD